MILDCDLLIGRDIASGRALEADELAIRMRTSGIAGGAVSSLRSLLYNARIGNEDVREVVAAQDWYGVAGLDLRDPLGAEREIERAAREGTRFVRFAPERQGVDGRAPRVRLLAKIATEHGLVLFVEGATPSVASSFMGLAASVVFLDQHFYDLGEFVLMAREEAGFHASTRLLGSPDGWEILAEEAGAERLLFGTRPGWFEEYSGLRRLGTSRLSVEQRELVTAGNLRRLVAGSR